MTKIYGLNVPQGLEDLFSKIFIEGGNSFIGSRLDSKTDLTRQKKTNLKIKSLFVKWESLYSDFTQERRTSWDNYWIWLPFSSHFGQNGWPGSGYSAFVWVNAPRYRDGLDLLLDPPFSELVLDGDFSNGFIGWTYAGQQWSVVDGVACCGTYQSGPGTFLDQNIDIEVGKTYRLQFDLFDEDITSYSFTVLIGDQGVAFGKGYIVGHFSQDFVFNYLIDETKRIAFRPVHLETGKTIKIDNVSVIALP